MELTDSQGGKISKDGFAEILLMSDIEYFQKMELLKAYVLSLD